MKMNLSLKMFIATFLGIGLGIFLGDLCSIFSPLAKSYVMILKITAVPYLIVAIMRGIGQLLPNQSLSILKKGILVVLSVWLINIMMIFLTASTFPKASGSRISSYNPKEPSTVDFAELLIPENIFSDLANNIVPSIVVFSLILGIAVMHNSSKHSILTGLEHVQSLLSKVTSWISKITPYGTFFIIANQFGTIDLSTIKQVSTYIILYILCLASVSFWIVPRLISTVTTITYKQWLNAIGPVLLLAYTTNFVIVCLPFLITALEKLTKDFYNIDNKTVISEIQGLVSLVFNIPLGSLFITVFVIFLSVMFKAPFDLSSYFQLFLTTFLTSLGAVGLGSWLNSLSFLLDSFMLPQDSINLFLTSLPFTSGFQSMVSISQIGLIAFIVTLLGAKVIKFKWFRFVRGFSFALLPVVVFFQVIKNYNPFPPIESRSKSIYDLSIASNVSTVIEDSNLPHLDGDTLNRIKQSKILRVGYSPKQAPLSFKNSYGELVGFDIAFAHQLAYDLGCELQFIPLSYENLTQQINEGIFDIGMSAVSMNESRIQNAFFSKSYLSSPIVFVMREDKKKIFKNSSYIFGDRKLKIAALKGTSFEELLPKLFPDHEHVILESYNTFSQKHEADILIWNEYEAIAWILKHRTYRIMYPAPAIGHDTLCYILKQGDTDFLEFINNWLTLKKDEGFFNHQYNLWILGKTDSIEIKERRWSVIKNVLGWTK
jgi:Na+/H+-dicarboxylate symporter/ABC-type amino acid transport substrate-binding protein